MTLIDLITRPEPYLDDEEFVADWARRYKSNDRKGLLVAIEGIEGAGKTTHLNLLYYHILAENSMQKLRGLRLPMPLVREILTAERISHRAEVFFMAADRADVNDRDIQPMLKDNGVVLVGNYFFPMLTSRRQDREMVHTLHDYATDDTWADVTFVLDCPVEVAQQRLEVEGRIVRKDMQYVACDLLQASSVQQMEGIRIIDSTAPQKDAHEHIWSIVQPMIDVIGEGEEQ